MQILLHLLVLIAGYLCGSFPTGYLVARLWRGVDVRKIGSGRTGGTNVLRSAGVGPAAVTVVGDIAKGYLAVMLAQVILGTPLASALGGVAAIFGHNHSIFLQGLGGAGSMTNVGVLMALSPLVAALAGLGSIPVLAIWRFASLGSITLAVLTLLSLLVGVLWGQLPAEYLLYGLLSSAMIVYELRPNIQRLLAGKERKIGEAAPGGVEGY